MARGDVVHCALCGRLLREGFRKEKIVRADARFTVEREDGTTVGVEIARGSSVCWFHTLSFPHPEKRGLSIEARMQIAKAAA